MKTLVTLILIGLTVSIALGQNPKFQNITKIYVDQFGSTENSDLVREKIKVRLLKSKRFTLVEDKDKADAVLTGTGGSLSTGGLGGQFDGVGAFRLISRSSSEVVWAYEYKSGMFVRGSASSNVAKATIDRLEKDAKKH